LPGVASLPAPPIPAYVGNVYCGSVHHRQLPFHPSFPIFVFHLSLTAFNRKYYSVVVTLASFVGDNSKQRRGGGAAFNGNTCKCAIDGDYGGTDNDRLSDETNESTANFEKRSAL